MAPSWIPSQSSLQSWTRKSKDDYQKCKGNGASAGDAQKILHITKAEREAMKEFVLQQLHQRGLGHDAHLAGHTHRTQVSEVLEQLKGHVKFGPQVLWAFHQGEDMDNIDAAVRRIIIQFHTAEKRLVTRHENKQVKNGASSRIKQEALQLPTGGLPVSPTPAHDVSFTHLDQRVLLVQLPAEKEGEQTEMVAYSDILSENQNLSFVKLKAYVEDLMREENVNGRVSHFSVSTSKGYGNIRNDSVLSAILNREGDALLIAHLTEGNGQRYNRTDVGHEDQTTSFHVQEIDPKVRELSQRIDRLSTNEPDDSEHIVASIEEESVVSDSVTKHIKRKRDTDTDWDGLEIEESEPESQPSQKRRQLHTQRPQFRSAVPEHNGDVSRRSNATATPSTESSQTSSLRVSSDGDVSLFTDDPTTPASNTQASAQDDHGSVAAEGGEGHSTDDDMLGIHTGQEEDDEDQHLEDPEMSPSPEPMSVPGVDLSVYEQPPKTLPPWDETYADIVGPQLDLSQSHDDHFDAANLEHEETLDSRTENNADQLERERIRDDRQIKKEKEHFDIALLSKMYQLFKLDRDPQSSHPRDTVPLQGMARDLLLHQAYGAMWIMWSEQVEMSKCKTLDVTPRSIGFTYLGDEPGYCKSGTIACVIVLRRWLEIAWADVDASRRSADGKHLPAPSNEYAQPANAQCPSKEPWGICCPCIMEKPAAQLRPVKGINLFMVPTELIINSVKEWYKQVDMTHELLDITLWVQSTINRNDQVNLGPPGKEKTTSLSSFLAREADIRQLQRVCDPARKANHALPVGLLKYVCFCTPDSYKNWVIKKGIHNLPCGRYIRDEFHMQPAMNNRTMSWARETVLHRRTFHPCATPMILLASGTPVKMGPSDLFGAMSIACTTLLPQNSTRAPNTMTDWKNTAIADKFWRQYTPSGLESIQQSLRNIYVAEALRVDARQAWSALQMTIFLVRGRGSTWGDQPDAPVLMPLPRMKYFVQECTIGPQGPKIITRINSLKDENSSEDTGQANSGKKFAGSAKWVQLEKCGFFPYLSQMLVEIKDFRLGKKYVDQNSCCTTNLHTSRFSENIRNLARGSPKVTYLQTLLGELLPRKDFLGRAAKGIIFTKYSETALIIHLWIEKIFAKNVSYPVRSSLMYGSMEKGPRQKLADSFQNDDETTILVGVGNAMGTGITLTRAMFTILAEQRSEPGIWDQQIARMLRKGNYNWNGVLTFELFMSDWGSDKQARSHREGRVNAAKECEKEFLRQMESEEAKKVIEISDDEEDDV